MLTFLDRLRRASPLVWLLIFAAGMPWIRLHWGEAVLYPGHWLLSGALWLALLGGPRPRRGSRHLPLKPVLLLGAYLCLMAGLRGQWALLGAVAGTVVLNYAWALAAFRVGTARGGTGTIPDGMLLLMAAVLAMGLAGWGATYFWPPLCQVLNCPAASGVPFVFLGGWTSHEQYWLFLLLCMPVAATYLLLLFRDPRHGASLVILILLVAASGIALLAGARLWMMLLMVLASAGVLWRLAPLALPVDLRLLQVLALVGAVGVLLLYGLFPGYLGMAARGVTGGGLLKITYFEAPPAALSSDRETVLRLRLSNAGLVTLLGDPEQPVWLRARLLFTPNRGETRAFDLNRVRLEGRLPPGKSMELEMPLRLPHWSREGYMAWRLEGGERQALRFAEDSKLGFRFVNGNYRNFSQEKGNFLSALAQRARQVGQGSFVPKSSSRSAREKGSLLGRILDTLFFSPLWGLAPANGGSRVAFSSSVPFWMQLFQEFGAIGLLLAAAIGFTIVRRAERIASRSLRFGDRILWRLVPLTGVLVLLTGIFSPVLGSFHTIWGLCLLFGFIEGKHWDLFAQRVELSIERAPRNWLGLKRRPRWVPSYRRSGRRR
ncbi:MAG: hypothetical protein O7A69_14050 [SAR324 cluster bacterium]|nr:hypothetical protein [SAR324 cluster bacterium]